MTEQVMTPHTIIAEWCNKMSRSVTRRDIKEHMAQLSVKLRVYGVPGFDYLSFCDCEKRRQYEFRHNLLLTLTYKLIKIKSSSPRRIHFQTEETMRATSGKVIILNKDITIELTADEQNWQAVEDTINHWQIEE